MEFKEWPKMPRFMDTKITFTEKIDGTNGIICINEISPENEDHPGFKVKVGDDPLTGHYEILAGSRTKWITPDDDNYGFSKWVYNNSTELVKLLGVGYHYGEWWGRGIQRKYDMDKKVFSLFNSERWKDLHKDTICNVVPSLELTLDPDGTFDGLLALAKEWFMKKSLAAEQYGKTFTNPEGFVMWHDRGRQLYKFPINK